VSALSADELAAMRDDLETLLPDTCVIQSLTQASDGQGGLIDTWAAAGTVACRLDNGSGQKANVAQSVQPFSSWVLSVPYDADLTTAQRVVHGGETYAVIALSEAGSWLAVQRAHLERL
jgi:SPP1 family predicted phage head-tail adaptor